MKHEDILNNLAEFARDEEREQKSSPWVRLTSGELSAEEISALEEQAKADPEAALALAAHRPLDEAARERIADRLIKMTAPKITEKAATVHKLSLRRAATWIAPLALAAGLFLWFTVAGSHSSADALPEYAMIVKGGDQVMRGTAEPTAPSSEARIQAGATDSRFEIVARPATRIEGKVAAKAFAVRQGNVEPLAATVDVSDEGAVRVVGEGEALKDVREVRVVVARPELLSDEAQVVKKAADAAGIAEKGQHGWLVLHVAVGAR